ncbi:tyrosine-protein phosphatase Lar-like [Watersipora subatra]|uniref:tyrosine-protein phosphatase Lar-like n=1 Tax=Watersipora subatra TaxID=2589382 RepID=UPI00355B0A89
MRAIKKAFTSALLLLYLELVVTAAGALTSDAANEGGRFRRRVSNPCSVPTRPRSIAFGDPSLVQESDRKRWRYLITWQAPATINCGSISSYQVKFPETSSAPETLAGNILEKEVYTDGEIPITFTVTATNNGGFTSASESLSITTPTLPPQVAPRDLAIVPSTSNNNKCVKVSWSAPEYPNGVITGYQKHYN